MKNLKDYIQESLLDIEGTIKANDEVIKKSIKEWIKDNFDVKFLKISNNPNNDGKYEVSATHAIVTNRNIISLTNELFVWKEVKKYFDCSDCVNLTSLEGAPEKIGGDFNCALCHSLTSLKGAPEKIGGDINCSYCKSLNSLEGAPKKVGGNFYCSNCKVKFTQDDIIAVSKVKREIYI